MMNMFKKKPAEEKSDYVIEEDEKNAEDDDRYVNNLKINLSRMIHYAESADVKLQKEVAEKLANEAVKPSRQEQIVQYGGLKLLVPLARSENSDVQRLAAHALANLSVNSDNQVKMAKEGAIEILLGLLADAALEGTLRQCCKALANLAVNNENKQLIASKNGITPLIRIIENSPVSVKVEAVAAVANLAVLDMNEKEIFSKQGLKPIVEGLEYARNILMASVAPPEGMTSKEYLYVEDLAAQCARCLRNMSSVQEHRIAIVQLDAAPILESLTHSNCARVVDQAKRSLKCLESALIMASPPTSARGPYYPDTVNSQQQQLNRK